MLLTHYHAQYFAHEVTRRRSSDDIEKLATVVAGAQVDLNPHQVDAALFAFRSPLSKGALLADEVGLGKTIEAGLVLSQKWAERKRRVLVIVPSNLRKQWHQELAEKFFLPCRILETRSYNEAVKQGNFRPFEAKDLIVICSYQFARNKAADLNAIQWDLVVIDEAPAEALLALAKKRVPPRDPMPLLVPERPNQVWSADFMSDALYNGVRFRTFNVLDDFNREALAIEIDTSLPSTRLVRVFEQLRAERGLPDVLRTDNGPEFLGETFVAWCKAHGIFIDYIEPGKPNQNAYIERFNRSYREEVLDTWLFRTLDEVRELTWVWMLEYNEERDHDGLGGLTPVEALQQARIPTFGLST